MIKAIKTLILSALLLWPTTGAVMAAHTSFGFVLPHEIAEQLSAWHFDSFNIKQKNTPGCDHVATASLRTHDGAVRGYTIHAGDPVTQEERLVSIELWNLRGEKLFSWQNMEDYEALKTCHLTEKTPV